MAEKFKAALKKQGPSGVGMFGSGQWTIWEGYAANKLFKAGFRSNNIDPNARHCMASAVGRLRPHLRHRRADGLLRRHRGGGCVRPVGLEHGRDASDPVDAGDRPPAFRAACARRGALHLRAPLLRSRRHRDRVHAADRSRDHQRDREPHHQDRAGEQGFRRQAHHVQARHRPTSATACGPSIRWRRQRRGAAKAGEVDRHDVRGVREVRLRLHVREGRRAVRRAGRTGCRRWPSSTPTRRPR